MAAPSPRQAYGTIVVIGGGCYGGYYVRQLHRARAADALAWRRLVVVDRDAGCAVARRGDAVELVVSDWGTFLDRWLGAASADPSSLATDAIVPSPLMPHLALDWLERRARRRWATRAVDRLALTAAPATPWERAGHDGTHYVSFATWTCPVNCIEPARCPHTRGERTWTMPAAAREYVALRRAAREPLEGPFVFHCTHRAYGVGMIDAAAIVAADAAIAERAAAGAAEFLVGTVSHCHGALGRLRIGPDASPAARRSLTIPQATTSREHERSQD